MKILFYNFESFKKLNNLFKNNKENPELFVLGFSKNAVYFLTRKYYKLLKILKNFSKRTKAKVIFCFYILKNSLKLPNALFILDGKIRDLFGEFFSKKRLEISVGDINFIVLLYYDIYNLKILKQINIKKLNFVLGIEDEDALFITNWTKQKFDNKLVLFGLNQLLNCKRTRNITKLCENLLEYNIQIC